MSTEFKVRTETPEDYLQIAQVHEAAFNRTAEAELVDKIRRSDTYLPDLALVALDGERIVGHVLFSRVHIDCGESNQKPVLALAPLAVLPEYQRKGVGGLLCKDGIERAKKKGHSAMIVLGSPTYYPRFGFRPAHEYGIESPFPLNDPSAFMVIELQEDSLEGCSGMTVYPDFFIEID